MILEDEPISLRDKIIRVFVAIFLFILVSMLIITLLPGDLEKGLISVITGQDESNAGKVGKISIPMDYFHAARKDCYYRYKQYAPQLAENAENINSCAYQLVQNLKISNMIAEATGYTVSEHSILMDLSNQAREIYRSSVSAGYAKNELSQPDDIYKQLVRAVPMPYRIDTYTATGLFNRFLNVVLKKTDNQAAIEEESTGATLTLKVVSFSDTKILDRLDREILIPEEMIRKEYESSKEKEPYEKKRTFLLNKLKAREKQQKLQSLKLEMKKAGNLNEIARLAGTAVSQINVPVANAGNLTVNGSVLNLNENKSFWKDLTTVKFGTGNIGGPYTVAESTAFIEFSSFAAGKGIQVKRDNEDQLVFEFFNEINQSLTESFPIQRKIAGQKNAN